MDGKKYDFIKRVNDNGWDHAYNFFWWVSDPAVESDGSVEKTSRNVEVGKSTASFVKKKYGEAKKIKVSNKDTFYKLVNYGHLTVDTSTWNCYLEYTYKKDKDRYKLRFYLDEKNKVMAFAYLKNLQLMYNYPNKQNGAKVTFLTSAGDKIEATVINGKSVYILPDGAKLLYKESNRPEEKGAIVTEVQQWGRDGNLLAESKIGPENFSQFQLKQGEYDAKKILKSTHGIDPERYNDYLYFTMLLYSPNEDLSLSPKYYFFKFE